MVDEKGKSEATKTKENVNGLTNDWVKLEDGGKLLTGNVSLTHRKFKGWGHQAPAVCLVACAFHCLKKMNTWTKDTVDTIVACGDLLYAKSKQVEENRCREKLLPTHIYKYFFLKNLKVSMKIDVDVAHLHLYKDRNVATNLEWQFTMFLIAHSVGIFDFKGRYFTFWSFNKNLFLFDPVSHDDKGELWEGPPNLGYSCLFRFPNLTLLVNTILKFIKLKHSNRIVLYPCRVEKVVKVNVTPPESLEAKPPEPPKPPKKSVSRLVKEVKEPKPQPEPLPEGEETKKVEVSELQIPPERPRLQSVTNFADLVEGKCGILRTYTSQNDPKFAKNPGLQGFANALAALTMLRVLKSKHWLRSTLYEILKVGEVVQHEITTLPPGEIPATIAIGDKIFTPHFQNHAGAIGCLTSSDDKILSLEEALTDYLLENDCTIIGSDGDIAVWKEESRFYMFDPNACDAEGNATSDGVACVMWFASVKDLVAKYLSKIPPQHHKSRFVLCRITIDDLEEKADDWCNFKALSLFSWILRGTISQRDRRFPDDSRNQQCTANAAMVLAFQEIKPEHTWDFNTIDEILIRGDAYYHACVDELNEKGLFKHPHLMVDELKRTFDVDLKRIHLEIDDCLVNGIINAKIDADVPNLLKGFEAFFEENDSGVVTANDQTMAVWRKDDVYFYFDSHSRDREGLASVFGTACTLRLLSVEELTKIFLTNLGADKLNLYNISSVKVTSVDITEDGVVKPPLYNYQPINDYKAILRANISQQHPKFELNAGKQAVANCVIALAFNLLIPSLLWKCEDLDQVLVFGDNHYAKSMEMNYMEDLPEEMNVDDITADNVAKSWKIGPNQFQMDLEELSRGNLEDNLKSLAETLEGVEMFPAILESQYLTVALWKDDNLYYLFDPRSRDDTGQVFGKDDWSAKIVPEEEGDEEEAPEENPVEDQPQEEHPREDDDETEMETSALDDDDNIEWDDDQFMGEEEQEEIPVEKKGSAYWRLQEETGKACVIRFSRLEDLLDHIVENSPPNQRESVEFTWKVVKLSNTPVLHESQDPEAEEKDETLGDWHDFLEYDRCRWILRGTKTMADGLFPECNRSKQEIPMCMIALVVASIYSTSRFKQILVDYIMIYGDRLYTVARRMKAKKLKHELKLTDEEVVEILNRCEFDVHNYPDRLCLGQHLATWSSHLGVVTGDITSTIEEVLNVTTGLESFFKNFSFGVMQCKNYNVGVWQSRDVFYMFDPHRCGPSGLSSPVGVCCITRFCNLEDLAEVFVNNLPKLGNHYFTVHGFQFSHGPCPRERQPEEEEKKRPKLGGFTPVMLGKEIIRGSIKLKCENFTNGVNNRSAAVAFVALAVSLVHHPMTWTKLMIDAILNTGDDLYFDSVRKLGDKFNPWGETMDIQRVNTDFPVGKLKANWAIRFKEQCGIVDVKNSKTPNLRQGLERFFEENSHGILLVQRLILAIWEQLDDGEMHIYMYDPNSRGATGLPTHDGTACAIKFCNAKMAFDHVLACLLDEDKSRLKFIIVPVEIVVGKLRTKRKKVCKVESVRKVHEPSPKPYDGTPLLCPKKTVVAEQKLTLKQTAAEERCRREIAQRRMVGRMKIHQLNNREAIIRGLTPMPLRLTIPVNYVAFFMMQTAPDLDQWTYKDIELILETANLLYIDSFLAYKPPMEEVPVQCILRKFQCGNEEVKLRLHLPLVCEEFSKFNVLRVLNAAFMHVTSCLFNYDEYVVTVYFTRGFYYLFDPYNRDLNGDKTENQDGAPMLMKFWDLESMVEKITNNLNPEPDHQLMNFLLLFLDFEYVRTVQ